MKVKIYALINTFNDHIFYIGATTDFKQRFWQHVSSRTGAKRRYLNEIIDQGGRLEMIELDEVDFNEACFWEQHYIDLFRSFGYTLIQRRTGAYKPQNSQRNKHLRYAIKQNL